MEQKEKLMQLIKQVTGETFHPPLIEALAEHLLANGLSLPISISEDVLVNAAPSVRGQWRKTYNCSGERPWAYICDQCGAENSTASYCCPNCGADMDWEN